MAPKSHPYASAAWITSALDEQSVEKAIVLAGSLKRVKTCGKLVVITSSVVADNLRERLYAAFDLVQLLDSSVAIGVTSEDYAKVFAFSLCLFQRCVYLSPNTLVLRRCDELFELPTSTIIHLSKRDNHAYDSSVFCFTSSTLHFQALKNILKRCSKKICNDSDNFARVVVDYAKNNHIEVGELSKVYNQRITFQHHQLFDGCIKDLAIINFGKIDPKLIFQGSTAHGKGLLESYAIDLWWIIYTEEFLSNFVQRQTLQTEDPIAIIGISCRYPGANNLEEFWQMLIEGRDSIQSVPSQRWQKNHTITTASSKARNTKAGFLDLPVDEFDAKFFGIGNAQVEFLDPQQRLLHEINWEALEHASIDPLSLRGSQTGVFVGSWIHDYRDIAVKTTDKDFFRIYMGNSIAATAARLSFLLDITGPSIGSETGCSSAIVAIDMACKSLRNRESNLALASGVNLFLHPFEQETLKFVMAPDGRCKTFDAKADGFGRAEGVGALVLKRMSDAISDGDNIWALIRGSAISQEGVSKSLGTPTVHGESLAMKLALQDAGVHPNEVSFVEAHGTGTPVGDPMEAKAIAQVYSKDRTIPLVIGSVKTNIGHTEAASGITGIIKVVLSMKNQVIPPHLNFDTLNPEINLESIPAIIPLCPMEWKRVPGTPRLAGVSSFGISGTDGHVIIQEAPLVEENDDIPAFPTINLKLERPYHVMKISGKTADALNELLVKYTDLLEKQVNFAPDKFPNIAYTANIGRATFGHRTVITAKDSEDALQILKGRSYKRREVHHSGIYAKICFLFTGQGSQYPGMAQELYQTNPVFRMAFDKCDGLLETYYNIKIRSVLWTCIKSGEEILLNRTINSQISIFVIEYCLLRLWNSWGIKPEFVLGHSLGEFAAAVCVGILDLESALELVVRRSQLIDTLPPGKMLVVKAPHTVLQELLQEFQEKEGFSSQLDIAALNSPEQSVVAGDSEAIKKFFEFCSKKDVKSVVLASTHAFHSHQLDPMLCDYRKIAQNVVERMKLAQPISNCSFISGMEGRLITDMGQLDADYWVKQTREKVNFIDASQVALAEGCNIFIEIGPSPVLSAFVMGNNNNTSGQEISCFPSLRRNQNDWVTILDSLGKLYLSDFNVNIDWKGFDQFYNRRKVALPFHPMHKKKIWVDYRSTPSTIHPLLGHVLSNASKSKIFESEITLKQLSYLNDHAIGSTVIFPGAGFLEMCAVAGHAALQGLSDEFYRPRRAITLKGLRIEAPLALQEGKTCILQTTVELNDNEKDENEMGYQIKVYNWFEDGSNGKWNTHASANFLPLVTEDHKLNLKPVDVNFIQQNWVLQSVAKDLYDKLPEVGLRFGPTFQSLVCGWKNGKEDEQLGALFQLKLPEDHELYLIHAVVADAMLQASMIWMSKDRLHKKLHVPIQIQEFNWYPVENAIPSFVYCTNSDGNGTGLVTMLLDERGNVLATMSGVEFIETTVKLVESMIQQQSNAMPQLWEDIWKPMGGPMQGRAKPTAVEKASDTSLKEEVIKTCEELNKMDDDELTVYQHLDNLTLLYFLNALYELGWEPEIGQQIILKTFMTELGIVEVSCNFMRHFLNELVLEGILSSAENDTYIVKDLPESKEKVELLCLEIVNPEEPSRGDYRIISEMGKNLPDYLLGKCSPLNVLFPEDPSKPNLGDFYDSIRPWISKTVQALNFELSGYQHLVDGVAEAKNKPTFRVLEVGGGTGAATNDYLTFLEQKNLNFEYTFTDISTAFFMNAEVKFEKFKERMIYKKFNIEKDPLTQGFCPEYYDLIVACEVIHSTASIKRSLSNLRVLLKTNGNIQITETTKPDRRITLLVGLIEGYWRFEDFDLRPCHATMSGDQWTKALDSTGFKLSTSIGCYANVHSYIYSFSSEEYSLENGTKSVFEASSDHPQFSWLIFGDNNSTTTKEIQRRLKCLNRNVVVITNDFYKKPNFNPEKGKRMIQKQLKMLEATDMFEGIIYTWGLTGSDDCRLEQEQLSLPFLHLCQAVLELHKATVRIYTVTQGTVMAVEDSICLDPSSSTIWGIAKTFRNEQPEISMHCIDLSPDQPVDEQINLLFYELFWTKDGEEIIAFREEKRLVERMISLKIRDESLPLPNFCDRFQLILPPTKSISDLEFGFLNKYGLKEDEIEIQVKAAGLNFRDIFAVLKPTEQFDDVNSIGSDFAGVVSAVGASVTKWKMGDAVFGMNVEQQALPSHIKTKHDLVMPIPDNFTFSEAATIPTIYATSLFCLCTVAKIKRGDVVLIHTASGGVGLSAVEIARNIGASIIATAGSRRKRAYLKSIGIEHVFQSRNTDFGQQVLKVTGNRGVDIVLNSLTGPGFKEASLNTCAKHARFVEMSKLNIWTEEEVRQLRNDVEYTVADLSSLKREEWNVLLADMTRCMKENFVKPIPFTRFDTLNIRQALAYLQKAKHIGKVVCIMPETKVKSLKENSPVTQLFNGRSTYLITGGLGGLGLEVAKWMLNHGAKYLILASRNPPKPETENLIKSWNSNGKKVEAWQVDVGDYDKCKMMIHKINRDNSGSWKPLRGVFHSAGVLQDATLPNQTWDKFEKTYNAKVSGSFNLHECLTKECRLEFFVMFSSVTSLFGSPGQSNHSASNAYEDSLAHYRYSHGLPAATINWANWGEVGVATDIDFPGIRPIATRQGLRALEAVLKSNRLQTCVMNVDSFGLVAKVFPKIKGYVDDKRLLGEVKAINLTINTDEFWGEVDNAEDREKKIDVFKKHIKNMLKNTLKMDPEETIEDTAEFQGIGMDSLMLIEMRNFMQNLMGKRLMLTAAVLKNCTCTIALASRLVDMLENESEKVYSESGSEVDEQQTNSDEKEQTTVVPTDSVIIV